MIAQESIINQCEKLIREIINEFALKQPTKKKGEKSFEESVTTYLKFQEPNDWNVLCSLLDLLGDTEFAKDNFRKYGISGPTKIEDIGEKYLRLYGVLNTIYLQKNAVEEFLILVKHKEKSAFKKSINGLKIMKLRNVVGAHTLNFLDDNRRKISHQIARSSLNEDKIQTIDSSNNFAEYNLNDLINEYDQKAGEILFLATEKFISTVFKNGGPNKEKYTKKIKNIKHAVDGDFVIHISENMEPIIIGWQNR